MRFDPQWPPIWLRKLRVSAGQFTESDFPSNPEDGIHLVCLLSDTQQNLIQGFPGGSLGSPRWALPRSSHGAGPHVVSDL